ncbi:MAG: 2-C-methyl-D-erythritol 4-phosphate cytidylyltransferase [Putridiphycobacter sp.]
MTKSVIITAGGIGKRMGSSTPKQFMLIDDLPILMHTINQFYHYDNAIQIVVVLPENHLENWKALLQKYDFPICHDMTSGGSERFFSIKNGLKLVKGEIVAIHDGVRPFVSKKVIARCFETAEKDGAAIPVLPLKESLRHRIKQKSSAVNRSEYVSVQTPQCFTKEIIFEAYHQPFSNSFTDDASVVEANGQTITLVEGNDENIKITTPLDMKLAQILVKEWN